MYLQYFAHVYCTPTQVEPEQPEEEPEPPAPAEPAKPAAPKRIASKKNVRKDRPKRTQDRPESISECLHIHYTLYSNT